jgi:hypothetical protein
MSWPWQFVAFSTAEVHARRKILDRYGLYAQLSAVIPVAVYQLYRLTKWVYSERQRTKLDYSEVPTSPSLKRSRASRRGGIFKQWRSFTWWLEGETVPTWGTRGHWLAAILWAFWLIFLSVHKTSHGKDIPILLPHDDAKQSMFWLPRFILEGYLSCRCYTRKLY